MGNHPSLPDNHHQFNPVTFKMVSACTGKPIWTPPWCSEVSLVRLWNSSNAAYHHPHQSLSSIHPSNCWCELLYLVTHQLHFFWCRFPWKLFVCLSLLLIQQPWLEVGVECPYAETHRWAKSTQFPRICVKERCHLFYHMTSSGTLTPVLWPGSSGAMTGPIWHYDWAHPAPGSYNLGSFGTMTQAHPAPNLALVGHALPDLHHSTIWRLGLQCHTDIIPQSGGFGLHCCIYIVYSLEAWFALPHLHHSTIWRLGLHCHIYIIPQSGGWICTAIFTLFTIWRLGLHCHIYIVLQSGGWVCTAAFTSFYNLDQTWIRSFALS